MIKECLLTSLKEPSPLLIMLLAWLSSFITIPTLLQCPEYEDKSNVLKLSLKKKRNPS
jgi:hypothetical protein